MKHYFKTIALVLLLTIYSCGKDDAPSTTNTAPVISDQSFNASEAVASGNSFGTVAATDDDGDTLTYSITTNDNGLFSISSTGALSVASGNSLDYETATSHTITVTVNDGELSTSADMTINVIDEAENVAPVIADQTFTVAEDVDDNSIVANVAATDPDNDGLIYSISTNVNNLFRINASGQIFLSTGESLDFETTTSYTIAVTVSDGELSVMADITIDVLNVNEVPVVAAQTFTAAEDIANNVIIGTVVASDDGGNSNLIYSLSINPNNLFEINADGEISLAAGQSLDFETATSHSLTVQVADGNASTAATITIEVTDVVESGATVSTFAGGALSGTDGTGTAAGFNDPSSIAIDANGTMYVAENYGNTIRKITSAGVVTTFAGSGSEGSANGTGTAASFNRPRGVAVDNSGNVYVADQNNNKIRKITSSGVVTTFAGSGLEGSIDGIGTTASFDRPGGVAVDNSGNVYVADQNNNKIRKITAAGVVSTLAGNGYTSLFYYPKGITVDDNGNVYVADYVNHRIKKVSPSGTVSTIAGSGSSGNVDGTGTAASFSFPWGLELDANGDNLYVAGSSGHNIRKIELSSGEVTTVAGTGVNNSTNGAALSATFNNPTDIAIDQSGNLFILEAGASLIRKITF